MTTQTGLLALKARVGSVATRTGLPTPSPPVRVIERYRDWTPDADRNYRVIAQNIRTGEFVDWDVPLSEVQVTDVLSGPQVITGKFTPELPEVDLNAYDGWSTWLHVEDESKQIRASGILQPVASDDVTLTLDAEGPSGYAHGQTFGDTFSGIQIDPLDVVRRIWAFLQSYPDGDPGVIVDDTTSTVRIGTKPKDVNFQTSQGEDVAFSTSDGPYELNWWDNKDCGDEINQLAKSTPFDYRDQPSWNADKTAVTHRLRLGYPRLGRRLDLRFADGENITDPIPRSEDVDAYASQVTVLGAGDGSKMIRGQASGDARGRLRRAVTVKDKTLTTVAMAQGAARAELARRQAAISFEKVTVDTAHPNARWGTYSVGDDILVQGVFPWFGFAAIVHRITAMTWSPDSHLAELSLTPSASISYTPEASE